MQQADSSQAFKATPSTSAPHVHQERHFVRFLFPFSFSEQENGPFLSLLSRIQKLRPYVFRRSRSFKGITWNVEHLKVADTPFASNIKQKFWKRECWRPLDLSRPDYILPHVEAFVLSQQRDNDNDPEARLNDLAAPYVASYQLDDQFRRALFPKQGKCLFVTKNDQEWLKYGVEMEDIQLYLFRSSVGLLVLDTAIHGGIATLPHFPFETTEDGVFLEPSEDFGEGSDNQEQPLDLDHLVLFNRGFRRLKVGQSGACLYRLEGVRKAPERASNDGGQSSGKDTNIKTYRCFRLGDLIRDLLTATIGRENNAAGNTHEKTEGQSGGKGATWEAFYRYRLLTYTFSLISQHVDGRFSNLSYEQVHRHLYWLRHSFDENYRPTEADLTTKDNQEVLRTFENIVFGMSIEGGAVLAWDSDSEGTDFIRDQLHVKVRDHYFLLYLLALHQRLASINLARLIGQTNYHRQSLRRAPGVIKRRIRRLRERVFEFVVRCWFAEVSNMRMYTNVYRRWQQVLEVVPLLEEVKSEVEELDDYIQRIDADRQRWIIDITTLLFFPLVLFAGIMSMQFEKLMDFSPDIWLWSAAAALAYYLIVVAYMRFSQ